MTKKIILFDGECGFCNSTMLYIAERDTNNHFQFVSNLSELGKKLLQEHDLLGVEKETLILLKDGQVHLEAYAFREITRVLPYHAWISKIIAISPSISNKIYRQISKIRKKLPSSSTCEIPSAEVRMKFIM